MAKIWTVLDAFVWDKDKLEFTEQYKFERPTPGASGVGAMQAVELNEYEKLQGILFAAQQAALTEGMRADRFEAALRKVAELGGHEYMDCADIATRALGSQSDASAEQK